MSTALGLEDRSEKRVGPAQGKEDRLWRLTLLRSGTFRNALHSRRCIRRKLRSGWRMRRSFDSPAECSVNGVSRESGDHTYSSQEDLTIKKGARRTLGRAIREYHETEIEPSAVFTEKHKATWIAAFENHLRPYRAAL